MYFAILWKHPQISLAEINLLNPKRYPSSKKGIVLFDIDAPERLALLWGSIKSGRVITEKELQEELQDCKIIGVQEEAIGKHLKRTIGIRRFKLVKITHTDREIKEKWKEIINLDKGNFGVVDYFQNIWVYESIDFDKPARSMKMGMMPSKLAHVLINLGTKFADNKEEILVRDPFVGSWTTSFLANFMGYDTIGSDLQIKYAQENIDRWKTTSFANPDKSIQLFIQDSTKKVSSDRWKNYKKVCIASEWWLGPIVSKSTPSDMINGYQNQVIEIYRNFLKNILESKIPGLEIAITIPWYIGHENNIEAQLKKVTEDLWYSFVTVAEVYQREGQQVGRKICMIEKK